jgi:hypothetical protein
MTIYILYSADYELYLGGNYRDENEVLINPANDLLDMCDRLKIPLTLFADIFSILRYKEHNIFSFPNAAEKQLKDAIRRGHDVQSHVHPHWQYTRIEGNRYTVNTDYFLLGKLDTDTEALYGKVLDYLKTSRNYLHDLLRQVNTNYHCVAFRAGGYGLQPNASTVIKALTDAGFIIDSSIVPNLVIRNTINEIDFSHVPDLANYYLYDDVSRPSTKDHGIFEIPIASCTFSVGENFLAQIAILSQYIHNKRTGRSSGPREREKGYPIQQNEKQQATSEPENSKYYNFIRDFWYDRFYYLDCSTNEQKMVQCTKKYLKQFDGVHNNVFFSCNMHPKEMTKEHITALEKYHAALKTHYQGNIQAISYQQAAEMITKKGFLS